MMAVLPRAVWSARGLARLPEVRTSLWTAGTRGATAGWEAVPPPDAGAERAGAFPAVLLPSRCCIQRECVLRVPLKEFLPEAGVARLHEHPRVGSGCIPLHGLLPAQSWHLLGGSQVLCRRSQHHRGAAPWPQPAWKEGQALAVAGPEVPWAVCTPQQPGRAGNGCPRDPVWPPPHLVATMGACRKPSSCPGPAAGRLTAESLPCVAQQPHTPHFPMVRLLPLLIQGPGGSLGWYPGCCRVLSSVPGLQLFQVRCDSTCVPRHGLGSPGM